MYEKNILSFLMISFSPEQVDLLRVLLKCYKEESSLHWPQLVAEIKEWLEEAEYDEIFCAEISITNDNVPKFCNCHIEEPAGKEYTLNCFYSFLKDHQIVTTELMEAARLSMVDAHIISQYFDGSDMEKFSDLQGHYRYTLKKNTAVSDFWLSIKKHKEQHFYRFSLEASLHKNVSPQNLFNWNPEHNKNNQTIYLEYYGFISATREGNGLLLFTHKTKKSPRSSFIRELKHTNIKSQSFSISLLKSLFLAEPESLAPAENTKMVTLDFTAINRKEFDSSTLFMKRLKPRKGFGEATRSAAHMLKYSSLESYPYTKRKDKKSSNSTDDNVVYLKERLNHVQKDKEFKLGQEFLESVSMGRVENAEQYLQNGGDINYEDPKYKTRAVHIAAGNRCEAPLKWLIEHEGVVYNVKNSDGLKPSHLSGMARHEVELTDFLIRKEVEEKQSTPEP